MHVEVVKQYPGLQQVTRSVKVMVPGKHFPALGAAEQRNEYEGTAVQFAERHEFERHAKAWGAAHRGPGIRFVCESDAIDDPDHKGFWTTLSLWNRWRHDTYKNNRDEEKQYNDELPTANAPEERAREKTRAPPEIKSLFTVVTTGSHTVGGTGRMAGKTYPCTWYACQTPGCKRGLSNPIKHRSGRARGNSSFTSSRSTHSPVCIDEDTGEEYVLYSFDEMLPHHARFVEWCFRGWQHFYEARADHGLVEYIRGWDRRAGLPCAKTCSQLLEVYEELVDANIFRLLTLHKAAFGRVCAGSTSDVWSLQSCRESFGCLRVSVVLDGDMLAEVTGHDEYKGRLIDMAPILAFATFPETRHTGAALARWKKGHLALWEMAESIGLATEDGASNNNAANKILGQESKTCVPHEVARSVLWASGIAGKTSKNPALK
eukprot:5002605-Prymnesium_polylepis.1